MKRALAMGLGALMVAGSAAPASAASHIDFTGYYRIWYMNEVNTGHGKESRSFTDSYFKDRLNIDLTFSPTDEISVYWRLRGPDFQRWGTGTNKQLTTRFIYGEIKQDWGTVTIGRMSDDLDCAGLCTFGYMPATVPIFTNNGVFDRADIMDGVRYAYDWDNGFSILAQYVKLGNNGIESGGFTDNWDSDQDYDRFQLQGAYAWDGGGASLHVFYDRNAQPGSYLVDGWYQWAPGDVWDGLEGQNTRYNGFAVDSMGWLAINGPAHALGNGNFSSLSNLRVNKVEQWGLNPSIMHTFGDFSVHFEGMAQWGQAQVQYTETITGPNAGIFQRTRDIDGKGYGAYLDFDYNYGPGNVALAGWWVSGTDTDEMYNRDGSFNRNAESKSIADLVGGNFFPLLVAYNGVNGNLGGGNRHYGNAGNKLSAIGFANNAYENYVWEGHVGGYTGGQYLALGTNIDLSGNFVNDVLDRDVLQANLDNRTRTVSFNNGTDANHWAIALTGNHAFSDDISMHYGLAYLGLNKSNYRIANSAVYNNNGVVDSYTVNGYTTQDKDLGFEIDLGVTVQLLDNLSFTSAFGYMFNGDAYKQFKGYKLINGTGNNPNTLDNGDRIRGVWEDADDSYVWFNSLTFAF